jgi:putative ABC transport system substrate-binding protein
VKRREFIAFLGSAAAWPLTAHSQEGGSIKRVGYLTLASGPTARQSGAFEMGLQELGYRLGQNVSIEYRWGAGRLERLPVLAKELVELKPDVILVAATPVVQAVKNATTTIPIVIAHSADPVQTGFANSLARPGGNITGTRGRSGSAPVRGADPDCGERVRHTVAAGVRERPRGL